MNKTILRLAIPNILSNISVPLLGMVDTALMGRLESEIYLGAIALGSIIFNFIYWGFAFLRMGTTGMTAQAFGQGNQQESMLIFSRAMTVALGGGLLLLIMQSGIGWLGFSILEGDAEIKQLARQYFDIRIYAAPATLGLYAFHGWFLGMQNARYPLLLTLLVNLMNILFNLLFVFHFDMKANGVALGTVVAQYIGLVAAIGLFFYRYRAFIRYHIWTDILEIGALRRFFGVNADIFIRTICLVFTFGFFTSKSASIDALTLAANQVLLQYFHLMAYGVDGFAFAAESLAGKYLGARDLRSLRRAIRLLFVWGVGLGLLFALFYLIWGKDLLFIFTNQQHIIAQAQTYLWWMALIAVGGAVSFMWDGVYIGSTATRAMRNTMLIATLGVFLPAFYLSFPTLGNHGLWLAMTLFMLARGILLGMLASKSIFGQLQ
ncbi:MAG: MATE family efflux transporter [Bacteroidetes bacterium]|nr:MAG: MATE family efflux transporter [Bacteroidota bacterium]